MRARVQGPKRPSAYLVLLILILAAGLRLWRLDSLPPGLYHDEAYNGLDALSLLRGETFPRFYEGWELYATEAHQDRPPSPTPWPVFFEGNYGREALHIYLMALAIAFLGPSPFAIRLVPALSGVLAVAAVYLAAGALLPRRWSPGAPLFAAAMLALFFPAVHFSRFGIRPILFLPLAALCVHAFWRALARQHVRDRGWYIWFVAAGFWLGLGIYTYASARLFPLLFVVFVPVWLGRDGRRWRALLPGPGLMAAISLLVAAPLLLYFVRYPFYFTFRIAYVATRGLGVVEGKPWLTWLYNSGRVLRGIFWHGEEHLRHNLPGRPFLDPVQSALVIAGAVGASRAARQRPEEGERLRWLFLALWLLTMLLPSVLSGDAPHFGRLTGVAVPLAIFAGAGAEAMRQALLARLTRPTLLTNLVFAGLLATSATLTIADYFGRYAKHPKLDEAFNLQEWELGRYMGQQAAKHDVYLTPTQEEMATLYFAAGGDDQLHSFSRVEGALPLGRPGRAPLYLVRGNEAASSIATLRSRVPEELYLEEVAGALSLQSRLPVASAAPLGSWEGAIALTGWKLERAGNSLLVTIRWQSLARLQRSYTAFVHLVDSEERIVAQTDRLPDGYPTTDWRRDEAVEDVYRIELPAGLEAGEYQLRTGFYFLPTGEPLGRPLLFGEGIRLP